MQRIVELKHVGPKAQVRQLISELIDRLEEKLRHFPPDSVSVHVLFDENGSHTLYHVSVTCHIPRRVLAAHEESREAGATIREAFAELERQLEKHSPLLRRERLRKQATRERRVKQLQGRREPR